MTPGRPLVASRPASGLDRGLTALATRRPVGVLMVVLTVLTFGVISFQRLPRNLMPDISYPTLTVRTDYPGASPLDVETRVSRRLEEVLSQVRSLRRISSISRAGASDIVLEFEWKTDMSLATMDVREKAEQVFLPDEASRPSILRYDPSLDPIVQLGLYEKVGEGAERGAVQEKLIELRILAEEEIERELEGVEGVAAVQVRGGLEREIRIDVDEAQLKATGISMALINQRLKEENLNQASGMLYEGDQSYVVRTVNEFEDIDEIDDVILKREGTVPVRLKDVARVSWSYAEPEVITRINGNPCIKLDIYKEADANLVEVAQRVHQKLFGTPEERQRLKEIEQQEMEAGEKVRTEAADPSKEAGAGKPDAAEVQRTMPDAAVAKKDEKKDEKKKPARRQSSQSGLFGVQSAFDVLNQRPGRPAFLSAKLPPRFRLEVMSDQSVFIQRSLDDVRQTAIAGGILAVIVLYLFLRSFWFTLAVGLSIPLSVIATFTPLDLCGVSINMMSLGGLALGIGMLVDNSIVVLESIFRCRDEGDEPLVAALRGTREVAGAVTSSTLTTVAVFLPIVFVEGVAGQVFRDQALTVVISLLASLLVALYFLPALVCRPLNLGQLEAGPGSAGRGFWDALPFLALATFKRRTSRLLEAWRSLGIVLRALAFVLVIVTLAVLLTVFLVTFVLEVSGALLLAVSALLVLFVRALYRSCSTLLGSRTGKLLDAWNIGFAALQRGYERLLLSCLAHKGVTLAAVFFTTVVSFYLFSRLGSELIPEVHQGEFTVDIRLPVGTRVERSDEVLRPHERSILKESGLTGIASVTTTVGVEKDSIRAGEEGAHTAKMLVRLRRGENLRLLEERVKGHLRGLLAKEAELTAVKFQNPVLFSFKTPIEVEVKGYSLKVLRRITGEVEAALRRIPALKDVKSNVGSGYPEVHLRFDRDLLSRYGLTVTSVGESIRRMVQGEVPSYFSDGDRKVGMRVRLLEEDRNSLEKLEGLVLNPDSPSPRLLRDVAEIEIEEGPAEIRRISHQRAGLVTANLTGMDLGRVLKEVEMLINRVGRPPDFTIGFGGQKEEMDTSRSSLFYALLLATFLVYVVMAVQFESLVQPFVIILSLPLAMVGVSPLLWALEIPLSIVVFIGLIILAGIVVNNAIVLVDYVNQLRERGVSLNDALVTAGKVRLRPILMTTLTTVLGLLPLTGIMEVVPFLGRWIGTGEGGEVQAPMAITVTAGLSSSTVLTLIVVPVIYSLLSRKAPRGAQEVENA